MTSAPAALGALAADASTVAGVGEAEDEPEAAAAD